MRTRFVAFGILIVLACTALSRAATQEDVFKSISNSVDERTSSGRVLAVVLALGGVFIVLAVLQNRFKREASPKVVNHHGKLLREVLKGVEIKPADVKRLKAIAEQRGYTSPLTLLLCPSVLSDAVKSQQKKKV